MLLEEGREVLVLLGQGLVAAILGLDAAILGLAGVRKALQAAAVAPTRLCAHGLAYVVAEVGVVTFANPIKVGALGRALPLEFLDLVIKRRATGFWHRARYG